MIGVRFTSTYEKSLCHFRRDLADREVNDVLEGGGTNYVKFFVAHWYRFLQHILISYSLVLTLIFARACTRLHHHKENMTGCLL